MKLTRTTIFFIFFPLAVEANADNIWVKAKEGNWEPNASTLTDMKAGIEIYVKNEAKRHKQQLHNWNEYMFQYLASELNDQKLIMVNALCGKRDVRELESFYLFAGGGCNFSLRYDPEKKLYYDLFISGGP